MAALLDTKSAGHDGDAPPQCWGYRMTPDGEIESRLFDGLARPDGWSGSPDKLREAAAAAAAGDDTVGGDTGGGNGRGHEAVNGADVYGEPATHEMRHRGGGWYDVVEIATGEAVNHKALTRDVAEAWFEAGLSDTAE